LIGIWEVVVDDDPRKGSRGDNGEDHLEKKAMFAAIPPALSPTECMQAAACSWPGQSSSTYAQWLCSAAGEGEERRSPDRSGMCCEVQPGCGTHLQPGCAANLQVCKAAHSFMHAAVLPVCPGADRSVLLLTATIMDLQPGLGCCSSCAATIIDWRRIVDPYVSDLLLCLVSGV
jgi:hypothetical protein